jgi:hypothetical protein
MLKPSLASCEKLGLNKRRSKLTTDHFARPKRFIQAEFLGASRRSRSAGGAQIVGHFGNLSLEVSAKKSWPLRHDRDGSRDDVDAPQIWAVNLLGLD